jgi:hypothetical protein
LGDEGVGFVALSRPHSPIQGLVGNNKLRGNGVGTL